MVLQTFNQTNPSLSLSRPQFMLREFDTRRPQYDELTQSAEGILSQSGDAPQDPKDLQEVRAELGSISKQWEDLTSRLDLRSGRIDRAQGTSERYQVSSAHGLLDGCPRRQWFRF